MHEFQLRAKPRGRCHIQGTDVSDHPTSSENVIVDAVPGHVPVDLCRLHFHGEQQVRKAIQFRITRGQAIEIGSIIRICRLNRYIISCQYNI